MLCVVNKKTRRETTQHRKGYMADTSGTKIYTERIILKISKSILMNVKTIFYLESDPEQDALK